MVPHETRGDWMHGAEEPCDSFIRFPSRRSVVYSTNGIISSTQPLANACGMKVLQAGGNAADAAIAIAAGLNVTEPMMTGVGGDMFCIFYRASDKTVHALNGSGRSAMRGTLEKIKLSLPHNYDGRDKMPSRSVHTVTVPGAVAGWIDCYDHFGSGKVTLEEILAPAIALAEDGYAVSGISAYMWKRKEDLLKRASKNGGELLIKDAKVEGGLRAPFEGEIIKLRELGQTLRSIGKYGKEGFYGGKVGRAIVETLKELGSFMEMEDFIAQAKQKPDITRPINVRVNVNEMKEGLGKGKNGTIRIWEHNYNTQGIVALESFRILGMLMEQGKIQRLKPGMETSREYLHGLIESLRLAFKDALKYVCDEAYLGYPGEEMERRGAGELLAEQYIREKASSIQMNRTLKITGEDNAAMMPWGGKSDTVYFSVTDKYGNGISFINSLCGSFGSGIVGKGTGVVLQNRGTGFTLDEALPNVYQGAKRPYHTLMPGMVTMQEEDSNGEQLYSVFGVMGGFMQPQGHVQVLMNQLYFNMNPQQALDAPRIYIESRPWVNAGHCPGQAKGAIVYCEAGIPESSLQQLRDLGHTVHRVEDLRGRLLFGRGQIIRVYKSHDQRVYGAGSDMRGDGAAWAV